MMNKSASMSRGFSLIELMIAVVILSILASIAIPAYRSQVQSARRADAQAALLEFGQSMERYFSLRYTYQGAAAGGADTGAPAPTTYVVDGSITNFYNIQLHDAPAPTQTTFVLVAAPIGDQADDNCGFLFLDQVGRKQAVPTEGDYNNAGANIANCWR